MALLAVGTPEAPDSTEDVCGPIGALDIPAKLGVASFSLPKPEEGHRLISCFLSIRQPALREAVIEFMAALAAFAEEGR